MKIALFLISTFMLSSCNLVNDVTTFFTNSSAPTELVAQDILPTRNLTIKTDTEILNLTVEIADSPTERERGLMARKQLPQNTGMLFIFPDEAPRYFWMKNTLIPLDIVYLDAQRKVVSVVPNMVPCKVAQCPGYPSGQPAMFALELPAGFTKLHPIKVGDLMVIEQ